MLIIRVQMYSEMPPPIVCGMCGGLAGLFGGGFNQCFPIWVGASAGGALGCVLWIGIALMSEKAPLPIAQPVGPEPVVIQNIYIMYDITGRGKSTTLNEATKIVSG